MEFFAGIGLIRWALEPLGWRCVFANDIDPAKFEMYRENFDASEWRAGDIHEVHGDQLPGALLATACFPCTDLSLAGERRGLAGRHSSTFWRFTKILEEMGERKPPLLLIENVPGFLSSHQGKDFRAAVEALNELGYRVDSFIIDAVRFVPQSRKRLFLAGCLDELGAMTPLSETVLFSGSELRPRALVDFVLQNQDLKWSLAALPPLPDCKKRLADVLEDLGDDHQAWWPRERLEHLLGQMKPDHHAGIERMRSGKTVQYATVYRRMRNGRSMAEVRTDGISGCLRTPRGGSSRQILVKAGRRKVQARYMTPREYARLQGVDGNYRISGTLNRGLFGFGDAVCVPVIRWIVRNYLDVLARRVVARSHEAGGVLTGINGGKTHPRPAPQGRSTPVPPRT